MQANEGRGGNATRPEQIVNDAKQAAVGIDLGTTYSAIAFIDAQGRPTTIPNAAGQLITPSVVLIGEGGIIVGEEAVASAPLEADRVADCVKRDMGSRHYRRAIAGEHSRRRFCRLSFFEN
jgi:molecular chaperone DnaK